MLPSVMVTPLQTEANLSLLQISQLSASYYLSYCLLQIPAGFLNDRFPQQKILALACFCCAIGCYSFTHYHSLLCLHLGRVLMGAGSAFAFIGILQIANKHLPEKYFPFATGLMSSIAMAGGIFGDAIISNAASYSIPLCIGLSIFLGGLFYFSPKVERQQAHYPPIKQWFTDCLIKDPTLLLLMGCGGLLYFPLSLFGELWGVEFLRQHFQLNFASASKMNSLFFLGWGLGAPLMGWMAIAPKRSLQLLLGSPILATVFFTLLQKSNWLPLGALPLLIFCFGFIASSQILILPIIKNQFPKTSQATGMAIANMIIMGVAAIPQWLFSQDANLGPVLLLPLVTLPLIYRFLGNNLLQN